MSKTSNRLTPKQEKFCLEYVKGGRKSLSDAYRAAYNCEQMKPATVNTKACELMKNGKITARINELTEEAKQKAVVTLEAHLNELAKLRDLAADAGQYGAAIKAETARGKASGLYVDKQDVTSSDGSMSPNQINLGDRTTEELMQMFKALGSGSGDEQGAP